MGGPEPKRDRWGRPLIVPVGEDLPVAYLRPSSLPNQLNDDFAISRWKTRQLVLGMGTRKDLWLHAATLTAEHGQSLDEIAEAAQAMVAANTGAMFGTAIHGIIEREIVDRPDLDEAMIAAEGVRAALAGADLRRVDDTAELFVINDLIRAAGRWDGLVADADGQMFVFDIKTAARIVNGKTGAVEVPSYKAQAWGIQMATYAQARGMWTDDGRADNPWLPSTKFGKVAFVSREDGSAAIVTVDLEAGWFGAQLARQAYDWKKRKSLDLALVVPESVRLRVATPESTPAAAERMATLGETVEMLGATVEPPADLLVFEDLAAEIAAMPEEARGKLAAHWPVDVPTPKQVRAGTPLTASQLDVMTDHVRRISSAERVPFFTRQEPAPQGPSALDPKPRPPLTLVPDDGGDVDEAEHATLVARIKALDPAVSLAVSVVTQQAAQAGCALNVGSNRSRRRIDLVTALLEIADSMAVDDFGAMARSAVELVLGGEQQASITTGALLASFDLAEAAALRRIACAIGTTFVPSYEGDRPRLVPAA